METESTEKCERQHLSFDNDSPRLTTTAKAHGRPGDVINVAFTGTESELKEVMAAAQWYEADPLGIANDIGIGVDTVFGDSYPMAPVSNLFLFRRQQDLAFEQPVPHVKGPRQRHHVRFWRSPQVDQGETLKLANGTILQDNTNKGRPMWFGAASYDKSVGMSDTHKITHHVAAEIDAERAHLFDSLEHVDALTELYKVDGYHTQTQGKNGGGDPWHTDGALWVGVIRKCVKDQQG